MVIFVNFIKMNFLINFGKNNETPVVNCTLISSGRVLYRHNNYCVDNDRTISLFFRAFFILENINSKHNITQIRLIEMVQSNIFQNLI